MSKLRFYNMVCNIADYTEIPRFVPFPSTEIDNIFTYYIIMDTYAFWGNNMFDQILLNIFDGIHLRMLEEFYE